MERSLYNVHLRGFWARAKEVEYISLYSVTYTVVAETPLEAHQEALEMVAKDGYDAEEIVKVVISREVVLYYDEDTDSV